MYEQRCGGVAPRRRHEVGAGDLVAVRLGEAVHCLVEQLGRLVTGVPALVAVAVEAEVRGEVHHPQAALAQRLHGRRGGAVRICHDRRLRPLGDRVGVEGLQLERHAVARIELVVAPPGVRAGRHGRQLEGRMPAQDRCGHGAAVAGRADHCDAVSGHDRGQGRGPPSERRAWQGVGRGRCRRHRQAPRTRPGDVLQPAATGLIEGVTA